MSATTTTTNFAAIFTAAMALNVVLTFRSSDYYKKWTLSRSSRGDGLLADSLNSESETASNQQQHDNDSWKLLLNKYLIVYLLATLSDWLQGPYVYALYADYGFSQHDIAILFVAGFGSSMVFGSFVGGMADWGGRRAFVILYTVFYAGSCMTKHFKDFRMLLFGRFLGGIATSLLFSVFDAWLIRSHADAKLKQYLPKSFGWAVYCNSVVAIVAGLIANKAASSMPMKPFTEGGSLLYIGGYLNPFDIALLALVVCGIFARFTWDENYGETTSGGSGSASGSTLLSTADSSDETSVGSGNAAAGATKGNTTTWYGGLKSAFVTTIRNTDILLCGIISSLFEGSMYIFVFMWTPALTEGLPEGYELPFGLIFSTFMVCCMAGSSLFSICLDTKVSGEQLAVIVFGVAAAAMALVAVSHNHTIKFIGMLVFEITVGMYFPIMGTMKGTIVPESKRAAIYNLYRIPLNFIVLFSLLTDLTPTKSFVLNTIMLGIAAVLQFILMNKRKELVNALMADSGGGTGTTTEEETERLVSSSPSSGNKDSEA